MSVHTACLVSNFQESAIASAGLTPRMSKLAFELSMDGTKIRTRMSLENILKLILLTAKQKLESSCAKSTQL